MRRTRLQYSKPARGRGGSSRRGGYVPYLPGNSPERDMLDFSNPLRRREDRTSFFCDVCKQQMSSKSAFVAHCNSAFHKEKEGTLSKLVSEHEWMCHTCQKPFPSKVALDQHCLLVRHQPMYRIEGLSGPKEEAAKEVPVQNEQDKQDGSSQDKKRLFSFGPLKPPYYCDICHVDCLNNSNYRAHGESWRHRAAVDRIKDEEEADRPDGEGTPGTDNKRTTSSEDKLGDKGKEHSAFKLTDYYCDICDAHISCHDNYVEHLNGKRHRKHVSDMRLPYQCIFCDTKYSSTREFLEHYKSANHISKASRPVDKDEKNIKGNVDDDKETKYKDSEGDRDRDRRREYDGSKDKDVVRSRERGRSRSRERGRSRSRERGRSRSRERGRSRSRERRSRSRSRSRDSKTNRGKDRSKDKDVDNGRKKEKTEREQSKDSKERKEKEDRSRSKSSSKKIEKERDTSSDKSAKKSKSKEKRKSDKDKEEKSKKRKKRYRSSSSERSTSSNSSGRSFADENKQKLKSSKKKKEKKEGKKKEKRSRDKGSNNDNENDNEEERKVEIKDASDEDELGDLREKLNRSKNIVITKKVKNDNDGKGEQREVDTEMVFDNDPDLKKDEETILKHHKADLVLREQLLKEHTLEILKYKDAEDEYKRLCLEEDYLKKRLDLFRDGDPRKDSDIADLERIQQAIRDVREELGIRDLMIQEKERYLIVLKNRIEERTRIIAKAEGDSLMNHESDADTKQTGHYVGSAKTELPPEAKDNKPMKEEYQSPTNDKEDFHLRQSIHEEGDLRDEIERERILRKLAPGMVGLDPSVRKRIVDALISSETSHSDLIKPASGFGREKDERYSKERELPRSSQSSLQRQEEREKSREDSYKRKQPLNRATGPEKGNRSGTAGIQSLYEKETASGPKELYAPKRVADSATGASRKRQKEHEATDTKDHPGKYDFEDEWRKREQELREREEELRKREFELLEREKQRTSGSFRHQEETDKLKSDRLSLQKNHGKDDHHQGDEWTKIAKQENYRRESSKPFANLGEQKIDRDGSSESAGDEVSYTDRDDEISRRRKSPSSDRRRGRQHLSHSKSPDDIMPKSFDRMHNYNNSRARSSLGKDISRQRDSGRDSPSHKRRRSRSSSDSPVRRKENEDIKAAKARYPFQRGVIDEGTAFEKINPALHGVQKESGFTDYQMIDMQKPYFGEPENMDALLLGRDVYEDDHVGPIPVPYTSSALKEVQRMPEGHTKSTGNGGKTRREQFALWKSVLPTDKVAGDEDADFDADKSDEKANKNSEKVKEDIWDTAFGTGEEEPEDQVAIDIFSDLDVDNDYLKGRLHGARTRPASKGSTRMMPGIEASKQIISSMAAISRAYNRPKESPSPIGSRAVSNKPSRSMKTPEASSLKDDEDDMLYGIKQAELFHHQTDVPPKLPAWSAAKGKEETKRPVDSLVARPNQPPQQPRGILKRGILKKPTENFDQKPVQNPVEGNSDDFQEKVESDEKDTVSKEMEQEQASKELVDSEVHEQGEAGMITPEDLQKIELIIEDFKKQYGSNWDSSKIEADLKMVLERQRLTGPAEKTIKEGNAPLPGRSSDKPLTRSLVEPDRVPVRGSPSNDRNVAQQTLFPIKIPDKAANYHQGKVFPSIATSGKLRGEDGVHSTMRQPPADLDRFREDLRTAPKIERPIDHFEAEEFKDVRGEVNRQQMKRLRAMRDELRSQGGHNEREEELRGPHVPQVDREQVSRSQNERPGMVPERLPGIQQREQQQRLLPYDEPRRHNEAHYHEGPSGNASMHAIHPQRAIVIKEQRGPVQRNPGHQDMPQNKSDYEKVPEKRFAYEEVSQRGPMHQDLPQRRSGYEDVPQRRPDYEGMPQRRPVSEDMTQRRHEYQAFGEHRVARGSSPRHIDDNRFARRGPPDDFSRPLQERPQSKDGPRHDSHFEEPSGKREQPFEKRIQGLEREIIPGLADSWNYTASKEEQRSDESDTHPARTYDKFPESMHHRESLYSYGREGHDGQSWRQQGDTHQDSGQGRNFKANYKERAWQTEFPERHGRGPEGVFDRYSDRAGSSDLQPLPQSRRPDSRNEMEASTDEFFRYLFRTKPEDSTRGMFYCGACSHFIANETDRDLHANTEDHRQAVKKHDLHQPRKRQETSMSVTQMRQRAPFGESNVQEGRQFQPRASRGQRGMRPTRPPFNPQLTQTRPRGGMGPRYGGPL